MCAYERTSVLCACVDACAPFYACARVSVDIDACEYAFAQTTTKYYWCHTVMTQWRNKYVKFNSTDIKTQIHLYHAVYL